MEISEKNIEKVVSTKLRTDFAFRPKSEFLESNNIQPGDVCHFFLVKVVKAKGNKND